MAPKSPFDENFDGKVGDVLPGSQDAQAPAPSPARAVAPPIKTAAPAPRIPAPKAVAVDRAETEYGVAEQAKPAVFDQNALGQLLQYLILKEGREAAAAQANEERRKQIQKQRDRNAKDQDTKILLKQARCKHLKGGRKGPKTQNKDHAVYQFQFIDFSTYIRCRICGMKWFPKDTAEHLVRLDKKGNERRISNHTHKGWREALEMCDASTDTMATSERIPQVAPNAANLDAAGLAVDTRLKDSVTGELIEGVVL